LVVGGHEIAANAVGNPKAYAAALLTLEESRMNALKLGAAGGSLKNRLLQVIATHNSGRKNPSGLPMLLTILFATLIIMACSELIVRAASPDQRLLVAMETRSLAEVVLASLRIPTTVDQTSPAIQKAITEYRLAGAVSPATLENLARAIHSGMPPDLVLNQWRKQPLSHERLHSNPLPVIGSGEERFAIATQLTAMARETKASTRRASLARAACALLVVDTLERNALAFRQWVLDSQNVAMMELDPRSERNVDLAFSFHLRRVVPASLIATGLDHLDDSTARSALEAAAYDPSAMLNFAQSATAHEWDRLRKLLPALSTDAESRWRRLLSKQLATAR
jgi:hypothetical protein